MKKLPYDGLTIGNHDILDDDSVDMIATDFRKHWNGRFVSMRVE